MNSEAAVLALRALSQPHRLAAFRTLVQAGPDGMPVGALRAKLALPAATLSAHLNQLRAAGLVADRRDGRTIHVSAHFGHMDALLGFLTENCCAGAACAASRPPRKPR